MFSEWDDVSLSLNRKDKTGKYIQNMTLGPMQDDELENKILRFELLGELPSHYLFTDIDFSTYQLTSESNTALKQFVESEAAMASKLLANIEKEWIND